MDDPGLARRNRRIAWAMCLVMLGFAAAAVVLTLATTSFRREVDQIKPDSQPISVALKATVLIAIIVTGFATFVLTRLNRPRSDG